jgi:hypothetical protein
MYLPESDEKAELRLISKTDSLVKSITLTNIRGIQSAVVGLSELPKGTYTCQLFYKGVIAQSTPIYHSVIDAEAHSFDSMAVYSTMKDLELRVRAMEMNITFLRDYNIRQDSMIAANISRHMATISIHKETDRTQSRGSTPEAQTGELRAADARADHTQGAQ